MKNVCNDFITSFLSDLTFNDMGDYNKAWDIVSVMVSVFEQDISVPERKGLYDGVSMREIDVVVPVIDVISWNASKDLLVELLEWVSSDKYKISFIQHVMDSKIKQRQLSFIESESKKETVTLFSGGLDSFAGASFNFKNNIASDFIGYINKDEEGTTQRNLTEFHLNKFPESTVTLIPKLDRRKITYTQATRSLLYLSLAIAKSCSMGIKDVRMYENGIMSVNPEIGGRFTTKTTHPKTIYLYNNLLEKMNYDIVISNIFGFKTKGEIVNEMDDSFKKQIKNTHTCGTGRAPRAYNHKGQCGYCIPCILRKISISAYDNENYDVKYSAPYDYEEIVRELPHAELMEYRSNVSYYLQYAEYIKMGDINSYLNGNKPIYFKDKDYLSKQKSMFGTFVEETERFWSKYGFK